MAKEMAGEMKKIDDYGRLLTDLKARIQSARTQAALAINSELIRLYWDMGAIIVQRQEQYGWGEGIIDRLSQDLRREFPGSQGFSPRNLTYMRQFFLTYRDAEQILQQVVAKIPWGQNIAIFTQVDDLEARKYYLNASAENGWSRAVLVHQIETDAYARHAIAAKTTSYREALPAPIGDQAQEMLKDTYIFDFITLEEQAKERELEKALLQKLRDFLLELGKGFAFVGNQFRIEVGGREFFIDLLFYHRILRSLVVVDLKIGEFEPEMAGKMNFYLNALDAQERREGENPPMGIILCKSKNNVVVEYSLRGVGSPIGVSQYSVTRALPEKLQQALPSVEELEQQLQSSK